MSIRTFINREYALMKDDNGLDLDFIKLDRKQQTFKYGEGVYNIKRDAMYNIKLRGLIIRKTVYFYNIHNPNPLNFNKTSNAFEPIISPQLYNRMLENEILIKLNTLSKPAINWKIVLIVAGLALVGYVLYQYGFFNSATVTNVTNATTNITGNFTRINSTFVGFKP